MKVNFHVPFWRRAVQVTEPLSLITLGNIIRERLLPDGLLLRNDFPSLFCRQQFRFGFKASLRQGNTHLGQESIQIIPGLEAGGPLEAFKFDTG